MSNNAFFDIIETVNDILGEYNKVAAKEREARLRTSQRAAEQRAREAETAARHAEDRARQAEASARHARAVAAATEQSSHFWGYTSPTITLPVGVAPRLLATAFHSTDKVEILRRIGDQVPEADFKPCLMGVLAGTYRLEAVRALAHGGPLRRAALAAAAGACFMSASARKEAILLALG